MWPPTSRGIGRSSTAGGGNSALGFWLKATADPARTTAPLRAITASRLLSWLNTLFIKCVFVVRLLATFLSVVSVSIDPMAMTRTFHEHYSFERNPRLQSPFLTIVTQSAGIIPFRGDFLRRPNNDSSFAFPSPF